MKQIGCLIWDLEKKMVCYFSIRFKKKQSLLFSATFPLEIEELSKVFQQNPKRLCVDSKHEKNIIRQVFIEMSEHRQKLAIRRTK